ncbi:cupin domain-containing protein [Spongisporangium articulatum]|uniref:Cupin domain-containing protein n=1 Tax=Spongisporangium articulatum TaxID=3362603 RepID=A0ABW8AKS9_9ACTN
MTFVSFGPPPKNRPGFAVVAGRHNGLRDLMVIVARLLPGDVGPLHVHDGDEVLRVVKGEVQVRVGEETRRLEKDDVAVVGPGVPHGFRVVEESVVETVTAYGIGHYYRVDGELVEVFRRDMPWGHPPPEGTDWTSDQQLQEIVERMRRPL